MGVLPEPLLARVMPLGSNFRLNIDFARERKNVSGGICPVAPATRQDFPRPGNLCRAGGQITPLFKKNAGEKSRKSAENIAPCRHGGWLTRMNAGTGTKAARMAAGVQEKEAQAWPIGLERQRKTRMGERLKLRGDACASHAHGRKPERLKKQGGACVPP
ncbi:MAG TPA: hypothetical protein VHX18_11815 [Rhizomicrobium sp.]|nr:hypothetical protein [Rhizomicrobium sp.]